MLDPKRNGQYIKLTIKMTYHPGPSYPDNWNKIRWAIFNKCGYRCQRCGRYSRGNLHLHHIRPIGRGGTHDTGNLVPLCSQCHYEVHRDNDRRWLK